MNVVSKACPSTVLFILLGGPGEDCISLEAAILWSCDLAGSIKKIHYTGSEKMKQQQCDICGLIALNKFKACERARDLMNTRLWPVNNARQIQHLINNADSVQYIHT